MAVTVRAPLAGVVLPLADVPDQVFADGLVGPGLAIDPDRAGGDVVAPIDGTVVVIHPHAFVVAAPDGRAVLVHLGVDTVHLRGAGFTVHVAVGATVAAGDVVVTWRPADVEAGGRSVVCPVVALDGGAADVVPLAGIGTPVAPGDDLMAWG